MDPARGMYYFKSYNRLAPEAVSLDFTMREGDSLRIKERNLVSNGKDKK